MTVQNPFENSAGYILCWNRVRRAPQTLLEFEQYDLQGYRIEEDDYGARLPIIASREEAFAECARRNQLAAAVLLDERVGHGANYEGEKWFGVFQLGPAEYVLANFDFFEGFAAGSMGLGEVEVSGRFALCYCKPTKEEREKWDRNTREAAAEDKRAYDALAAAVKPKQKKRAQMA